MDEMQSIRWLRRPTLMAANGMYLLAAAGQMAMIYPVALIYGIFLGIMGREPDYTGLVYLMTVVGGALMMVPPILYAAKRPGVTLAMRINPPSLRNMVFAAISAPVAAFFFTYANAVWLLLIEALGGQIGGSNVPVPTNSRELMVLIFMVGVLPGIYEEVLFRGTILGAWERRGTRYGVIVSGVLFGLMHGSIEGLITHIGMGLVLGCVVVAADSLYVGMLYHTVFNTTLLVMSYIGQAQSAAVDQAADASLLETLGGAEGVSGLLFLVAVVGLLFAGTLVPFFAEQRRKGERFERIKTPDRAPMPWRELAVLLVGLVTVAVFYLRDALNMFWGIVF